MRNNDLKGAASEEPTFTEVVSQKIDFVDAYDFHSAENYLPIFTSAMNRAEA